MDSRGKRSAAPISQPSPNQESHSETLGFEPSQKQPRLSTDFSKCLKCQSKNPSQKLCRASSNSIIKFVDASKLRKDSVFQRLKTDFEILTADDQSIFWHLKCYKEYTHKRSLQTIADRSTVSSSKPDLSDAGQSGCHNDEGTDKLTRSVTPTLDWSKCIFCQRITYKKDRKLSQVLTFSACEQIKDAAAFRNDQSLITKLASLDLIAQEAKYHKQCHAIYTSQSNLKSDNMSKDLDDNEYESQIAAAFAKLIEHIDFEMFHQKKALNMAVLTDIFRSSLAHEVPNKESYRSEKLKRRLQNYYGERIVFQHNYDRSKPQFVYSSDISVQDAINTAARLHSQICDDEKDTPANFEPTKVYHLFNAAEILRSDLKQCKGLQTNSIDPRDISMNTAETIVPNTVYNLLKWVICGAGSSDLDTEDKDLSDKQSVHRHILSIGQDMIYAMSKGSIKTPKHIGLGVSVKHLTGSKKVIAMLNRFGHSISYDDTQRIDTSIAESILESVGEEGVILPTNIAAGSFVHAASDNIDINEETLDGFCTTHATSIVLYQRKNANVIINPTRCKQTTDAQARRRALRTPSSLHEIKEISRIGQRPASVFSGNVELQWFHSEYNADISNIDHIWMFARLCPVKLFEVKLNRDPQLQVVSGWSAFNATISTKEVVETSIGYCPLLNAPPTEYSTIHTVMETVQKMMSSLQQEKSVLTFDEAIYSKAKEIQWKYSDEFADMILRLGGFHIALNFLGVIGHIYEESGLEDVFIEADLYGSNTVTRFLKGKMYNRGVRAHKLLLEALLRLKWDSFCQWLTSQGCDTDESECDRLLQDIQKSFEDKDLDNISRVITKLQNTLDTDIAQLHKEFSATKRQLSETFVYWDNYTRMVLLLLQYIRAERGSLWEEHLQAVTEMIPYFFAADHTNYAKWCSVYVADMRLLPVNSKHVLDEFQQGNHTVTRSGNKFASVWSDMALEQSVNCHAKSKSGVIGFSKQEGALDRWFLTAHERASITSATHGMCGFKEDTESQHRDAGKQRMKRDEHDVQKLTSTITELMTNPFEEDEGKLRNISTGVVPPDDVSENVLNAREKGLTLMDKFIENRLIHSEEHFFSPLKKTKLKTFASIRKCIKYKDSQKKSLVSIDADRELFSRLVVVGKTRDVDLKTVLQHELSSVPLSLARPDGTLNKGTKSKLLEVLEKEVDIVEKLPGNVNSAWILDGMANIQMMRKCGATSFGELAEIHFNRIQSLFDRESAIRVDIVFDRYDVKDSIKSMERARRSRSAAGLEIRSKTEKHHYLSNGRNIYPIRTTRRLYRCF